jgi:class 3 adenylate cyclase
MASAQHDQDVSGELPHQPEPALDSHKDEARPTFLPRLIETPKLRLKRFLKTNPAANGPMTIRSDEEPIADLFHNTTVLFADIAGFTAWSSEREPPQVFKLLETLYSAFDNVANTLGVFKVETIGDCYVAVTGLPEPQADHAVRMAKFANAIILKMQDLTKVLESSLGPSTANLSIRVGLHSGPVTAGVLRGQKARFQLFGDTINTASRMESTGNINKIQISQATADLLVQAGQSNWLTPRQELLAVKGKGEMQTYWINSAITTPGRSIRRISSIRSDADRSVAESFGTWGKLSFHESGVNYKPSGKTRLDRLVDWNTDLLLNYLRQIVAKRFSAEPPRFAKFKAKRFEIKGNVSREMELHVGNGLPIDEITDAVAMPTAPNTSLKKSLDKDVVDLSNVQKQLRHYVARIASMYRSNPFHCFEHASHVVMSACKLLKRIVRPEDIDYEKKGIKALSEVIHRSTFGISSDPLLQFAVVFSALIHDVDHRGIPNAQLVNDRHEMAIKFNNKSVAEQHSLQVAWNLLMEENYADLRACIYGTDDELVRFRQLLVNAVLATDIADQSQIMIRKKRWEKAFHSNEVQAAPFDDGDSERKASLVFEYVIQASDVAHTMQHWHVYIKWNERLFEERYLAYVEGRAGQDPSLCWYQDEIWFFDSYIIPLAKKLSECGVFGVSSEEYLTYALENRSEWEEKGRQWVAQMVGAQAKAA